MFHWSRHMEPLQLLGLILFNDGYFAEFMLSRLEELGPISVPLYTTLFKLLTQIPLVHERFCVTILKLLFKHDALKFFRDPRRQYPRESMPFWLQALTDFLLPHLELFLREFDKFASRVIYRSAKLRHFEYQEKEASPADIFDHYIALNDDPAHEEEELKLAEKFGVETENVFLVKVPTAEDLVNEEFSFHEEVTALHQLTNSFLVLALAGLPESIRQTFACIDHALKEKGQSSLLHLLYNCLYWLICRNFGESLPKYCVLVECLRRRTELFLAGKWADKSGTMALSLLRDITIRGPNYENFGSSHSNRSFLLTQIVESLDNFDFDDWELLLRLYKQNTDRMMEHLATEKQVRTRDKAKMDLDSRHGTTFRREDTKTSTDEDDLPSAQMGTANREDLAQLDSLLESLKQGVSKETSCIVFDPSFNFDNPAWNLQVDESRVEKGHQINLGLSPELAKQAIETRLELEQIDAELRERIVNCILLLK
ncbi:hypothetical protein Ciccas_006916 [Cichlidogyrus casuarinus]|uniref:Uncharacterized protein n=1 Tax=Cichlidogyrus casuarinus TaxID=1844966 RepID=A0ABD2Q5P3_9PLAT